MLQLFFMHLATNAAGSKKLLGLLKRLAVVIEIDQRFWFSRSMDLPPPTNS